MQKKHGFVFTYRMDWSQHWESVQGSTNFGKNVWSMSDVGKFLIFWCKIFPLLSESKSVFWTPNVR